MERWNNPQVDKLMRAILNLRNIAEAKKFFRDLLTEQELIEFGKRWQAANMLSGNVPYSEIVQTTGLSSTTVARISKWLKGGKGGYRLAISRQNHHGSPSFEKRLS